MYIVTDTHSWVWFLTANPSLSQKAKSILSDPSNLIVLPCEAEALNLATGRKVSLAVDDLPMIKACKILKQT